MGLTDWRGWLENALQSPPFLQEKTSDTMRLHQGHVHHSLQCIKTWNEAGVVHVEDSQTRHDGRWRLWWTDLPHETFVSQRMDVYRENKPGSLKKKLVLSLLFLSLRKWGSSYLKGCNYRHTGVKKKPYASRIQRFVTLYNLWRVLRTFVVLSPSNTDLQLSSAFCFILKRLYSFCQRTWTVF